MASELASVSDIFSKVATQNEAKQIEIFTNTFVKEAACTALN